MYYLTEIQDVVEEPEQRSGAFTDLCDRSMLLIREAVVAHKDIQQANHRGHRRSELVAVTTETRLTNRFIEVCVVPCNLEVEVMRYSPHVC